MRNDSTAPDLTTNGIVSLGRRQVWEPPDLSVDDINGLRPHFFHDPMLDDSLKVTDDCGVVQIHVSPTMALD